MRLLGLDLYLPPYPEIYYGDEIVVEGVVDGDKLKDPELLNVERERRGFFEIIRRLVSFYDKVLPSPHAALVAGITLGSKEGIGEVFWEKLRVLRTLS